MGDDAFGEGDTSEQSGNDETDNTGTTPAITVVTTMAAAISAAASRVYLMIHGVSQSISAATSTAAR